MLIMNRCIVVTNISPDTTSQQLKTHFQEVQNGGGQVTNIVYPLDLEEKDTAVITFANEDIAIGTNASRHVINGQVLNVRPLLHESWKVPEEVRGDECPRTLQTMRPRSTVNENNTQRSPKSGGNKKHHIKPTARMSTTGRRQKRPRHKVVLRIPAGMVGHTRSTLETKSTARMSTSGGKFGPKKLSCKKRKRKK